MPRRKRPTPTEAEFYKHPESESLLRPDVGTQAQFRKKKPPKTYRYDSSLAPELRWDGQNPAREEGEQRLATVAGQLAEIRKKLSDAEIQKLIGENPDPSNEAVLRLIAGNLEEAEGALRELKAMSSPFLNWAGKAERLSFDVPTLPLFVHERLSTKAILETLKGHTRDRQADMFQLFGDPQHSVTDQILGAYEHTDKWVNRMILGDSLVVMNSLLRYEFLGEQVQMIYIDPPYGVKFGSNFQPFVRKRDVAHNDDDDMTREPEMVQAYRDTWELALHSYLTYLRDRLFLARDLLAPSGSIFVQISDENLHHVRELMDEIFGAQNCISVITFRKTGGEGASFLGTTCDFILWYSKDRSRAKYNQLFLEKKPGDEGAAEYTNLELPDGSFRPMSDDEIVNPSLIPVGAKVFATWPIVSPGYSEENSKPITIEHNGKSLTLRCPPNRHWSVGVTGTLKLWDAGRLLPREGQRIFKRYISDFSYTPLSNQWTDTRGEVRATYVVQTSAIVIQRCLLMTTDPGDLVLDPTCGSGTTASVAEQWGRRWLTIDTS